MQFLLDTHTFLWFINDSHQLSRNAKAIMESEVDLILSLASLWENAIKFSLGKLNLPDSYENFIPEQIAFNDIDILPIKIQHLTILSRLPFHHRDPFDRLLIAQAIAEKISIISADSIFDHYEIHRLW